MTVEELQKAIEQVKAQGFSEEEILGGFYKMFQDDKLTLDELDGIVNLMGYHLTDDFKNMSPEDQKTNGVKETEDAENKEDADKLKETDEDGEVTLNDKKPEESGNSEESEKDEPKKEEPEDDEEKKAMKLFGQGK